MTAILGLNAFHGDAAAALVIDGELVAAAEEERFTRRKHGAGQLPWHAMLYCLGAAGGVHDVQLEGGRHALEVEAHRRVLEAPVGGGQGLQALVVRGDDGLRRGLRAGRPP